MTSRTQMVVSTLKRVHSQRVTAWKNHRRAAGPVPSDDGSISWTADHVIDDPREPHITPIGILDARGMMLLRVSIPIKVPMGFAIPQPNPPEADEVETIVPEDMLAVSEVGLGVGYVTPDEVEGDVEPDIGSIIEAAMEEAGGDREKLQAILADLGIGIQFREETDDPHVS